MGQRIETPMRATVKPRYLQGAASSRAAMPHAARAGRAPAAIQVCTTAVRHAAAE